VVQNSKVIYNIDPWTTDLNTVCWPHFLLSLRRALEDNDVVGLDLVGVLDLDERKNTLI
jgi:hypothetical protein